MIKLRNVMVSFTPKLSTTGLCQKRPFWGYVNKMFNTPDPDRIKAVGPDRACAEWVLKNGGGVVWASGGKTQDYNALPTVDVKLQIAEIDGTGSSISHYGFSHLVGTKLSKVILHNNLYIDDMALKELFHGKNTLTYIQISKCPDVTDAGVKELKNLPNLDTLVLFDLVSVKNLDECKEYLKSNLPNCTIKDN